MSILNIIYLILGLIILWFIFTFNSFIKKRMRVKEALADIEVQLKRRYDLIPNLVETVKGYMQHEKSVFENVTLARTKALEAKNLKEKVEAENMLSETLKTLFAVSENYPDLKANANFLDLQREIADTENKIQAARRFYNSTVMDFNTKLEVFPSNIVGKIFNFQPFEFFETKEEVERETVKVKF